MLKQNKRKVLIFLDLPRNTNNYLNEIKKLDLEIIILLPLKSKNAKITYNKRVNRYYKLNFMEFNEVLSFIKKTILSVYDVIRIMTHNEYNIELCGFLEENLIYSPIINSKIARLCRDKKAMRDKLKKIGCYTLDYTIVNHVEDAIDFYSQRNKSIVLKPRFGTASLGVVKINNISDIRKYFKLIKMTTLTYLTGQKDNIIAEEYFEGKEYGIESLMHNGKLQLFVVSEKPYSFKPPFFEESIYFSRPDLSKNEFRELSAFVERINIEFGVVNGPSHLELRINDGKRFVIEIAARNGSSFKYLSRVLRKPFEAVQLKNLLGIDQKKRLVNDASKNVAYYLMQSPGKGKLVRIDGLKKAKEIKEVFSIDLFKKKGDQIVPFPFFNGYIGTIYAEGKNRKETLNSIVQAHNSIKIIIR